MASDNILVAVKARPFISKEKNEKLNAQWAVKEKCIYQIDSTGHRIGEPYSFDHIFNTMSTNEIVYQSVVEPLIRCCLEGFNSTIFAYGQTSSGKTHTMTGASDIPGIIQLTVHDIFNNVLKNKHRQYLISCSYFEIYNEKIFDLLDNNGRDLKIHEDVCGNTFVHAKQEVISIETQVFELMKIGNKIRKISGTNMNERSSRSHTIFRFTIESTDVDVEDGPVQISQLNLVDLAGSERISQSKVEGARLKEGVNINKSLLTLGNVIRQLSDNEGFISYRDSKLTRLLQQALGGNAKSLIIATITLAAGEETKSTLEFAQRAKAVRNKPKINEILTEHDKEKQYQFITAEYKQRLANEVEKMKHMETAFQEEKIEHEREIAKLKQQVALINRFTRGFGSVEEPIKVSRRHTVGHYKSYPLKMIPEEKIFPSTYSEFENIASHDRVTEGEHDSVATEGTNEEMAGRLPEETLLTVFETLPKDFVKCAATQTECTESKYSKKTFELLEHSYTALKEFTSLEAECKEDKSRVEQLIKEKENLLKDVIDLHAIIRDEKRKYEIHKMNSTKEIESLSGKLEQSTKMVRELTFKLEITSGEAEAMQQTKDNKISELQFLLDRQAADSEEKLKYLRDHIKLIGKEDGDTTEIDRLRKEKCRLEDEKSELEKRFHKIEENKKQLDEELLNGTDKNNTEKLIQENRKLKMEYDELKSEMLEIKEENKKLTAEHNICRDLIHEKNTLLDEVLQKNTIIDKLTTEIQNFKTQINRIENENVHFKQEIGSYEGIKTQNENLREEKHRLEKQVENLEEKVEELQVQNENLKVSSHSKIKELEQNVIKKDEENDTLSRKLKEEVEKVEAEKRNLNDEFHHKQNEITALGQRLNALKLEVIKKDEDIAAFKLKLKGVSEEIKAQEENFLVKIRHREREIEGLQGKVKELEQKMAEKNDTLNSINENVQTVNDKEAHLLEKIRIKSDENEKLKYNLINAKAKISQLEKENKDTYLKNVSLAAVVCDMENAMAQLKCPPDTEKTERGPEKSRASAEMSPREVRKLKRQSIHDQRRSLEREVCTCADDTGKRMTDTLEMDKLKQQVELLKAEKISLEKAGNELKATAESLKQKLEEMQLKSAMNSDEKETLRKRVLEQSETIQFLQKRVTSFEEGNRERTSHSADQTCQTDIEGDSQVAELRAKITELTEENEFLEKEVQGFIGELECFETYKKMNREKTETIKSLEGQIKERDELVKRLRQEALQLREELGGFKSKPQENEVKLKELLRRCEKTSKEKDTLEHELVVVKKELEQCKLLEKQYVEEIEKLKSETARASVGQQQCSECESNREETRKLKILHRNNSFKMVDLQTKIYDLKNEHKLEKDRHEEQTKWLQRRITQLEARIGNEASNALRDAEVQCNIWNYNQFLEKYRQTKKLAEIRREDCNILRARLGMNPDDPVD